MIKNFKTPLFVIIVFAITSLGLALGNKTKSSKNKKNVNTNKNIQDASIIHGELVKLSATNKRGEVMGNLTEYYIRCSIQDYFIKLCESKITKEDLDKYYDESKLINSISVKGKIVTGNFDICNHEEAASRIGNYITIDEII